MSVYKRIFPTSSIEANLAGLKSNQANAKNVFLTAEDLSKDGITNIIFVAANGGKWKKTVDNAGAFVTTAV